MSKKYDDILKQVLNIPEFNEKIKELKITNEEIKKSFSMSDLLNILDNETNPNYTTTIYLNDKKDLNWKYTFANQPLISQNTLAASTNYVYKSFPNKMLGLDTKDIHKTKERALIALEFSKIIKSIESNKKTKGLYIVGNPGVGKSFMSIIMLNRLSRKGKKVAHIFMPDFMAYLKDSMGTSKSTYDIIDMLKKVEILLIDDLGAETVSSWTLNDVLVPILNYRADSSMTTFITSSLTPEQYINHYKRNLVSTEASARRLVERIKVVTKLVVLEGQNHRD